MVWRWRLNLLTLTLLVLTVSFALNVGATRGNPLAAFYSPQARFWELLVGATLAHLTLHGNRRLVGLGLRLDRWLGSAVYAHAPEPNGQTLRDVLSATGTALIAMGLLLITKESQFPGWWAAMPTIGTALVITAGPRAWLNRTLYSNRVLVWFGLISFPLYLWHWPLLSFARILEGGEPSRGIRIMAVLVAIAAAWLTYVLVEKPVRNGRHAGSKTAVLAVLMVVAGFAGYATYRNEGLASRKANEPARMFAEVNDKALREVHFNEGVDRVNAECKKIIGPTSNGLYCQMMSPTPTILIVGDSHAVTFGYSATAAGNKDIAVVSANGCLPLMSHVSIERKVDFGVQVAICQGAINAALKIARETPSIRHVVLVGRGPLYTTGQGFGIEAGTMNFSIRDIQGKGNPTNGEAFVAGHLETIAAFQKLGKKVVFAIDVPELGIDPKTCIDMRPLRLTRRPLPECAIPVDALDKRQASYRALVAEIVAKSPSVEVFDPKGALCDGQKCYGMRDGTIYYYDDDHLSKAGSARVFESFLKWLSARPQ